MSAKTAPAAGRFYLIHQQVGDKDTDGMDTTILRAHPRRSCLVEVCGVVGTLLRLDLLSYRYEPVGGPADSKPYIYRPLTHKDACPEGSGFCLLSGPESTFTNGGKLPAFGLPSYLLGTSEATGFAIRYTPPTRANQPHRCLGDLLTVELFLPGPQTVVGEFLSEYLHHQTSYHAGKDRLTHRYGNGEPTLTQLEDAATLCVEKVSGSEWANAPNVVFRFLSGEKSDFVTGGRPNFSAAFSLMKAHRPMFIHGVRDVWPSSLPRRISGGILHGLQEHTHLLNEAKRPGRPLRELH